MRLRRIAPALFELLDGMRPQKTKPLKATKKAIRPKRSRTREPMPVICIGPVCIPWTAFVPIIMYLGRPIWNRCAGGQG